MKKPTKDQILPYGSFDESNTDLFVCEIKFDAEIPYMCVSSASDVSVELYYSIPDQMAHYARVHAGYTQAGQERRKQDGRRELAAEIKRLLSIKDNE